MKTMKDQIIRIVLSIIDLAFSFYIQVKTGKTMAVLYGYCIIIIIYDIKEILKKNSSNEGK